MTGAEGRREAFNLISSERLDDAHDLVQNDSSPDASYLHGMIHREEGDLDNARYWFARAGEVVARLGFDPMTVDRETERTALRCDLGAD